MSKLDKIRSQYGESYRPMTEDEMLQCTRWARIGGEEMEKALSYFTPPTPAPEKQTTQELPENWWQPGNAMEV